MSAEKTTDPRLSKLIKDFAPEQYLFVEGDVGKTMFLIINGVVSLTRSIGNISVPVLTVGPGDVIGERAIFKHEPHRRSLSAKVTSQATVIEFDAKEMSVVEAKFPNFMSRVLSTVRDRLDQANELISILQSTNDSTRLVDYIMHYFKYNKKAALKSLELPFFAEKIELIIKMDKTIINRCFQFFIDKKVMAQKDNAYYVIDEQGLKRELKALQEYMA